MAIVRATLLSLLPVRGSGRNSQKEMALSCGRGWCETRSPCSQMETSDRAVEGGPGRASALSLGPSAVQGPAQAPSWAQLLGSCN